MTLIKAQTAPTEAAELQRFNANKYAAMLTNAEAMRLYVSKADPTQADAGLAGRQAGVRVQVEDPVQPGGGDHHAAVALRGVVIAPAEPAGNQAAAAAGGFQQPGRPGHGGRHGQFGP